jgi:hypothetical protein
LQVPRRGGAQGRSGGIPQAKIQSTSITYAVECRAYDAGSTTYAYATNAKSASAQKYQKTGDDP